MFIKLLLLSSILVGISLLGLSIRILLVKNGRFPQTSVGKNKEMKKRGITCVKHDEVKCYHELKKEQDCSCDE